MSFNDIITYPFSLLLLALYNLTSNYGLAVILFAVVIKVILLPFQMKSKRSMMRTTRLNPILKELEKKHEGNKQKYQEEVAKLYKEEKINPMSGCLWTLIPFPILIALYSVIRQPFTRLMRLTEDQVTTITNRLVDMAAYELPARSDAYHEITLANLVHDNFDAFKDISSKLVDIDFNFLGMNLGLRPQWNFFANVDWSNSADWAPALGLFLIPIISGLLAYLSMKVSNATNPSVAQQQGSMKGMMMVMPLFSIYIGFIMPAALGIYWIANSVLASVQDTILNRYYTKILDKEDAERREKMHLREAELERKRLETEKLREIGATERNKNTSKKKIQSVQKAQNEERLAAERAKEKERRRAELGISDDTPASQVGNRRYARGRAYVEDRFTNPEGAEEATKAASAFSDIDEAVDKDFSETADVDSGSTDASAGNDAENEA
ncbi:MAG: membrane protein insertase YidC [Clostridiales bacterium]|nr:membrane protein insertase YidC [Clostridiales bacterium]